MADCRGVILKIARRDIPLLVALAEARQFLFSHLRGGTCDHSTTRTID